MSVLSLAQVRAFLDREFPQVEGAFAIEEVGPMRARMRLVYQERHLRPGGTISGPAMFGLADVALYVAILANIGPVGLAVTTNLNINFLKKPEPADLIGEARLIKLGKRLAVGEVSIFATRSDDLVAHAVGTYSIPPRA
ncbi:MAG: PaaI family thioesterase [Pseudomonadota bacterium]|nr:PaaI family thioesterase [Pseudomonadota bacterium]